MVTVFDLMPQLDTNAAQLQKAYKWISDCAANHQRNITIADIYPALEIFDPADREGFVDLIFNIERELRNG